MDDQRTLRSNWAVKLSVKSQFLPLRAAFTVFLSPPDATLSHFHPLLFPPLSRLVSLRWLDFSLEFTSSSSSILLHWQPATSWEADLKAVVMVEFLTASKRYCHVELAAGFNINLSRFICRSGIGPSEEKSERTNWFRALSQSQLLIPDSSPFSSNLIEMLYRYCPSNLQISTTRRRRLLYLFVVIYPHLYPQFLTSH